MVIGLVATVLFAFVFGVAAIPQAAAVRALPDSSDGAMRTALAALRSPLLLLVVMMYLLGWLLHAVSIKHLPLYLAQSGIAASLAVTAVSAAIWLGEGLTRRHWLAIGAVIAGLALLVAAAGPVQDRPFGTSGNVLLIVGVIAVGASGLWWARQSGHGLALSAMAGVSYAGSSVATRALVDGHGWGMAIAAVATPIFGVLGFWFYSVAMQRVSVAAATTVVVAAEVVIPGVVGMLLLHDGLNPTRGWLVVPGLLLTIIGGVVVESRTAAEH